VQTLGCTVGHKILWSGYKVRPLHANRRSPQSSQDSTTSRSRELEMRRSPKDVATAAEVGGPPTQSSAAAAPRRTLQSENTEDGTDANRPTSASHGSGSTAAPSSGNSKGSLQYPPRPLWRGRHCELLNEDLSVFGRAQIQGCMPEEPFDEDPLGDYDVGIIFLSEGEDHVQMTTFQWPLLRVRLEGARYLSDIVQWLLDNAISNTEDGGLEGLPKNPYRHMKRERVQRQSLSKLNKKTSTCDVQRVSS
jgi:hypothetical protein